MLRKWFLAQNLVSGIIKTSKFDPFIQHMSFPFSTSRFCSATTTTTNRFISSESESESDTHPLPVSYLINNFGFSTQSALKAFNKQKVRFNTPDKPNSVLTFLKNHGFSESNIRIIIRKSPWLLSSKPHKTLLPKFQFFLSKGVSSSDIVPFLTANPRILQISLEKRIIPLFEFLSKLLKTSKDVIACLIIHSEVFAGNPYHLIVANINLMTDFGVCDSAIARLLQNRPRIFGSNDLIKSLEEVKGLGFDPSMTNFGTALMAKKCMIKKLWGEKVDTLNHLIVANINLMTDFGVCDSTIATLVETRPYIFGSTDLIKTLEEIKGLGFHPSTTTFGIALKAKGLGAKLWDVKVNAFKKWGWSDEDVLKAFGQKPQCMLVSIEKINSVMSFWVNQLGWDAMAIAKTPHILSLSLEKTIIPRAAVVQYLLSKGLRNKSASLICPFILQENLFVDRYIKRFKDNADFILRLYEEKKLNHTYTKDKACMP